MWLRKELGISMRNFSFIYAADGEKELPQSTRRLTRLPPGQFFMETGPKRRPKRPVPNTKLIDSVWPCVPEGTPALFLFSIGVAAVAFGRVYLEGQLGARAYFHLPPVTRPGLAPVLRAKGIWRALIRSR
jgi:hypothetical protein